MIHAHATDADAETGTNVSVVTATLIPVSVARPHSVINYGDITVGVLRGVGCIATAADEDQSLAMLLRHPGESLLHLLARLDQAIDKAYNEDLFTDEINPPPKRPEVPTTTIRGTPTHLPVNVPTPDAYS